MYIVISKPKRRSVYVGVVHCMTVSLVKCAYDGPHVKSGRRFRCKLCAEGQARKVELYAVIRSRNGFLR